MKRFFTFVFSIAIIALMAYYSSQAQEKRVLIEQYTGAWCGWCVDGSYIMDNLLDANPGKVFGVKVHQGDDMQTVDMDSLSEYIAGFPSGGIDRFKFAGEGNFVIYRDQWAARVAERLNATATADVAVSDVTFDPSTRKMTAKVTASFFADETGDLRLNLYVVEDSVSGTGSGYDQQNYLSNRAGYENNPFYKLPSVIKGYQHRHVVRAMLGGTWGTANVIPASAAKGSFYSYTYSYTVPANIKADQVTLLATVTRGGDSGTEVLNVIDTKLTNLPPAVGLALLAENGSYTTAKSNGTTTQKFTLKNTSSEAFQARVSAGSKLPDGWTATVSPEVVEIPAGESVEATLTYTAPEKSAFVSAVLEAFPIVPNKVGRGVSTTLYALSDNTKYAVYGISGNGSTIQYVGLSSSSTYGNSTAIIPFNTEVLNIYPADKFDVVYMDLGGNPLDYSAGTWPVMSTINKVLNAGKKVFVSAYQGAWSTYDAAANAGFKTAAAKSFFKDFLGVEYIRRQARNDGQRYTSFTIQGLDNNEICQGISFTANLLNPYLVPFTDIVRPLPGSKSQPIMQYDNDESSIAAVRCDQGDGKKVLYFTTSMNAFWQESDYSQIMDKGTEWLLSTGGTDVKEESVIVTNAAVSPNPITNSASLQFTAANDGNATVSIVNALGVKVADIGSSAIKAGLNNITLPTDNLTSGTYTVLVISGGTTQNIPFVVAR
ncbi:hypothetical protein MASR2M18_05750 [Ignavibacteria bacterium]|nr:Omp28-related outer membrane protein [Bacteroidota bacterium]